MKRKDTLRPVALLISDLKLGAFTSTTQFHFRLVPFVTFLSHRGHCSGTFLLKSKSNERNTELIDWKTIGLILAPLV